MKKILFTLVCLLALVACSDHDEPTPSNDPTSIYVTVTDNGIDYIYSLEGDLIYQADPDCSIKNMAAGGQDWYALVKPKRSDDIVVKNGTAIYTTPRTVLYLRAGNDGYYTLEKESLYTDGPEYPSEWGGIWGVYRNGALLYDLGTWNGAPFQDMQLHQAPSGQTDIIIYRTGGNSGNMPWVNGKEFQIPENIPGEILGYDIENNETLLAYRLTIEENDGITFKDRIYCMYNGQIWTLNDDFSFGQALLDKGNTYILGGTYHDEDHTRNSTPMIIINGKEKKIDTGGDTHQYALKLLVHNSSTYVLTHNDIKGHSFFYRDLKPLDTGSIFLQSKGQKVKLGDILFYDFIVVDKPINNQ